jgi:predicted dehydrogenase
MTAPVGLGMVGCGGFGAFTLAVYTSMPDVRVFAVTDVDAAACEAAAERCRARAYPDLESLLADRAVDLVVIATPPWLHGPQALAAAEAGRHLFVEKPLATDQATAERLLVVVGERGLRLSVDYVLRHVPLYRTLRVLTESGLLGAVTHISLENHASNEALHADHWFWDRMQSGGIFVEHGVHFFDLASKLAGSRPALVSGCAHTMADGRQNRVQASVGYANGVLASFYHAFDRPAFLERTALRVTMECGSARAFGWIPERLDVEGVVPAGRRGELAELLGAELEVVDTPAPPSTPSVPPGMLVRATLRRPDRTADYADAVRAGMADLVHAIHDPHYTAEVTPEDAFESLRLALAAQQAVDTRQIVFWDRTQAETVQRYDRVEPPVLPHI